MKCYCSECGTSVELKDGKDRETGMYYNYWYCEEHGKVKPSMSSSGDPMLELWQRAVKRMQESLKNI